MCATTGRRVGASKTSAERSAYPSIAEFANGGRSTSAATGSASTRPAARSIGTLSESSRFACSRTIRCASATEMRLVTVLTDGTLQRYRVQQQVRRQRQREGVGGSILLDCGEGYRPDEIPGEEPRRGDDKQSPRQAESGASAPGLPQ